ncbi:MAG: DNA gyrase C-terminal beta-propeller domain-containing protein [Ezakiella massiliensis]
MSSNGTIIRIDADGIRETGRATSGVKLMDLVDETIVSAIQTEE